jgi:hypothetical protein
MAIDERGAVDAVATEVRSWSSFVLFTECILVDRGSAVVALSSSDASSLISLA